MKPRLPVLPVVALAAALLAGCSGSGGQVAAPAAASAVPAVPSPSPTPQFPRDELQAALAVFRTSTYTYTVTGDFRPKEKIRATGAHDPHTRAATWTAKITGGPDAGTVRQIVIGAVDGGTWRRLARTDGTVDPQDPDGLRRFATSITITRRTGPHAFTGDLYVLESDGKTGFLPLGAPSLWFRQRAWAQYTAALDEQGHVTSIGITIKTSAGTLRQNIIFSGYGRPVTISKPA
jgi:hypothetical protein